MHCCFPVAVRVLAVEPKMRVPTRVSLTCRFACVSMGKVVQYCQIVWEIARAKRRRFKRGTSEHALVSLKRPGTRELVELDFDSCEP